MFSSLVERITGKDDLERVAAKEDRRLLSDYLKSRRLLFPKRPMRFLDASAFTQEELMSLIEDESKELGRNRIDLWVLEFDGKKRLPAFSSQSRMQAFSAKMSQDLNKVFALGCVEALLSDIAKQVSVEIIDLNLFSRKSWEVDVEC